MTDGTPVNIGSALPFMGKGGVDPGFSKWQLDPRDVIELLEHALKGEVWTAGDEETPGKWEKPTSVKPMLNETGIQVILQKVTATVNRVVIMSNLDNEAIDNWLWDIGHSLAAEMVSNLYPVNNWDLEFKNLDALHDLVMLFLETALKRALLDGERKKLYEAQEIRETRIEDTTAKRGGAFSWIPGMG